MSGNFDSNPVPICKPFKQNGYCPYGDSCIYIHDRTDYVRSFDLEKRSMDDLKGDWRHYQHESRKTGSRKFLEDYKSFLKNGKSQNAKNAEVSKRKPIIDRFSLATRGLMNTPSQCYRCYRRLKEGTEYRVSSCGHLWFCPVCIEKLPKYCKLCNQRNIYSIITYESLLPESEKGDASDNLGTSNVKDVTPKAEPEPQKPELSKEPTKKPDTKPTREFATDSDDEDFEYSAV